MRVDAETHKAYLALFVCLFTKALYLEVVSDVYTALLRLSTALDRFIARREILTQIHSDCSTNYVGAACNIKLYLKVQKCRIHVSDYIHESHISWNLILLRWNTNIPFRRIDDNSLCRMGIILILGHLSQRSTIQTIYAPWHGEIFYLNNLSWKFPIKISVVFRKIDEIDGNY